MQPIANILLNTLVHRHRMASRIINNKCQVADKGTADEDGVSTMALHVDKAQLGHCLCQVLPVRHRTLDHSSCRVLQYHSMGQRQSYLITEPEVRCHPKYRR